MVMYPFSLPYVPCTEYFTNKQWLTPLKSFSKGPDYTLAPIPYLLSGAGIISPLSYIDFPYVREERDALCA